MKTIRREMHKEDQHMLTHVGTPATLTMGAHRQRELAQLEDQARTDGETYHSGIKFGKAYVPPVLASPETKVYESTWKPGDPIADRPGLQIPADATLLVLNLRALEVATYVLGRILWARVEEFRPDRLPTLPLAILWAPSIKAGYHSIYYLRTSDFISHTRPASERPRNVCAWAPETFADQMMYMVGHGATPLSLLIKKIRGEWMNSGRRGVLPWGPDGRRVGV